MTVGNTLSRTGSPLTTTSVNSSLHVLTPEPEPANQIKKVGATVQLPPQRRNQLITTKNPLGCLIRFRLGQIADLIGVLFPMPVGPEDLEFQFDALAQDADRASFVSSQLQRNHFFA